MACRFDLADLEERARAEHAVVVRCVQIAVEAARVRAWHMQRKVGAAPEFGPKVTLVDLEILDDRRGGADALVQLFEDIVVDQVDLNVFVAATLAGRGVGLAEQIEFRSSAGIDGSDLLVTDLLVIDLLVNGSTCGFWSGAVFGGRFRGGLGLEGLVMSTRRTLGLGGSFSGAFGLGGSINLSRAPGPLRSRSGKTLNCGD